MEFGMFLPMQLPRPWGGDDEDRLFHNALEWVEIGERAGIMYAWAQEHHFLEEYSHSSAPEVLLAAVSQRTQKMRLGHGITLMPPAYNHPARVAERIATLDLISNGRVEWGTGESSSRMELEAFGISYVEKRGMWAEAVREATKMMCAEPYPGHRGRHFSMPPRNVVPKPRQRPHPPLWVACTNRDTIKLAAQHGLGALTFAFVDAGEAKYWVQEYYDAFKADCTPLGRTVNPNIAVLSGSMCHEDKDHAISRGVESQRFFKWALSWYFVHGTHTPARTRLWEEFLKSSPEPMAGLGGVGDPQMVREHFRTLEKAGVDQVILLQHAGRYGHDDICHSLDLLGKSVFPEFLEREEERKARKAAELEPYNERAMQRVPPLEEYVPETVEAYPSVWQRKGAHEDQWGTRRSMDAGSLWRLNVGGEGERESDPEE